MLVSKYVFAIVHASKINPLIAHFTTDKKYNLINRIKLDYYVTQRSMLAPILRRQKNMQQSEESKPFFIDAPFHLNS